MGGLIAGALFLAAIVAYWLWKRRLKKFPLAPGPWFKEYAGDYARQFNIPLNEVYEKMTSAVIEGTNGFIWATETPEWDRDWFEECGYAFPKRWVPFSILKDIQGPPGPVRLDI
ncbi:MAG: hypothetical protein A4E20_11045 [Nitrospira sp. SG-bin2]|uniref:hypothetical protein n=1 Tax=Nitrospira cf. moscoviensis SBR1015 TaxID=96242 RepID=UPI000A0A9693|nr:hypothetical protein [Nitrospira cf. moscoviensis SBR1015]OQW34549.1 MAG: hypothetical protein A4E20_11045 [Nitrospira sp. SG-bin2]